LKSDAVSPEKAGSSHGTHFTTEPRVIIKGYAMPVPRVTESYASSYRPQLQHLLYKLKRRKRDGMTYLTFRDVRRYLTPSCYDAIKEVVWFHEYGQSIKGVCLKEKCAVVGMGNQRLGTLSEKFWREPNKKWMAFWFKPRF
jgi:hypothetical protein